MVRNIPFNRRLLLAIVMLSVFILLVIAMLLSYILATNGYASTPLIATLFSYHLETMLVVSFLASWSGHLFIS